MKIFLIHCLFLFSLGLCAQDGVFAYAYNPEGNEISLNSENSDVFNEKMHTAQTVLNDLIEAKGIFNVPAPQLIMTNGEQKPASIDLKSAQIILEEKAFDLCMDMGVDSMSALAALLGHELIHYYENHDWSNHFLKHYGGSGDHADHDWENHLQLEMQADQLGGFLCVMAGYPALGVLQRLLPAIYKSYALNESTSQSYPSLAQRIEIAKQSENLVHEMNLIFKMSSYLTVAGEYEMANQYLDHLILRSKFQSRELYNNKAVLLTLSALSYFSPTEMPFIVPLELDIDSRLARKFSDKTKRIEYLGLAEKALKSAITLDKDYVQAYINLASVHILQNNYFDAEYLCNKVIRMTEDRGEDYKVVRAHAWINLGIIEYLKNHKTDAENYFKKALKMDRAPLARYNLNVLNGQVTAEKSEHSVVEVQMDEVVLDQLFSKIMREEEMAETHINLGPNLDYFQIIKNQSAVHVHFNNYGDEGYYFFQEGKSCAVNGKQLEVGFTEEEVTQVLGNPSHIFSTSIGRICAYSNGKIQIQFDDHDLVDLIVLKKMGS